MGKRRPAMTDGQLAFSFQPAPQAIHPGDLAGLGRVIASGVARACKEDTRSREEIAGGITPHCGAQFPVSATVAEIGDAASRNSPHHGAKPRRGRGAPQKGFYLNEAQALLVCMFSDTDKAADVRQQLIEVFLAWRHGQMVKAPTKRRTARLGQGAAGPKPGEPGWTDPMRPIDARRAMVVRFRDFHAVREDERLVRMVAHMLPPGGRGMKLRNPDWWHDIEVRHMLIRLHRQCTVHQASDLVEQSFGRARTPGERSINRFWVRLDGLFGTGRRLH